MNFENRAHVEITGRANIETVRDERGLVVEIDGMGAVDDVTERILVGLAERGITA